MFKQIITGAAMCLLPIVASAADLPSRTRAPVYVAPPVFTWTGFYVGAVAGYGFGTQKSTSIFVPGTVSVRTDGVVGGVTAGYNYQVASFVFGLEADIMGSVQKGSGSALDPLALLPSVPAGKLEWMGTVRGRVGYAIDKLLIYGTGGLAVGGVKGTLTNVTSTLGGDNRSASGTQYGWVIGAGLEYAITSNISAKLEYLYADLGKKSYTMVGPNRDITFSTAVKSQVVRAGLNYRF
jgi:outer membrane immunogenic protein